MRRPFVWDVEFEVSEADPRRRIVWRSVVGIPFGMEISLDLEPAGSTSTRATCGAAIQRRRARRRLAPLLAMEGRVGRNATRPALRRETTLTRRRSGPETRGHGAPSTPGPRARRGMTERFPVPPSGDDHRTRFERLISWFEGRRLPWWLLVALVYLIFATLMTAAFWIDGSAPVGTIGRPALDAFYPAYGLFMLLYLRRSGHAALDRFLPALRGVDPATIDGFRRRLTSLTDREAIVGVLVGTAVGIATVAEYLAGPVLRADIMGTSPLSHAVVGVASVFGYALGLVGVVFVISALTAIPAVHRAATTIDVRHPDPAHAFATLSARGGILLLILVAFSAITDPATFEGVNLPLAVTLPILAIVAFVAPLLGMRRRLDRQKASLLDESSVRIEALEVELERTVDAGELDRIRPLTDALNAYHAKRDRIARASTMPWDTATLRGFGTALLLPVATWLATTVLGRVLSF